MRIASGPPSERHEQERFSRAVFWYVWIGTAIAIGILVGSGLIGAVAGFLVGITVALVVNRLV